MTRIPYVGMPADGPYCEECCIKLPEWRFSWGDPRTICNQCKIAMYLNEIAMHLRGEY